MHIKTLTSNAEQLAGSYTIRQENIHNPKAENKRNARYGVHQNVLVHRTQPGRGGMQHAGNGGEPFIGRQSYPPVLPK